MKVEDWGAWAPERGWAAQEWQVPAQAWMEEGAETNPECHEEGDNRESYINYIGKGGKQGGKGFQGTCYVCGEFGHSQRDCAKAKGKGKSWGVGKGDGRQFCAKGFGKNQWTPQNGQWYGQGGAKGSGKGYGEQAWGKGAPMVKVCFSCGQTGHFIANCLSWNSTQVQSVEVEPEIHFVGSVQAQECGAPGPIKIPLGAGGEDAESIVRHVSAQPDAEDGDDPHRDPARGPPGRRGGRRVERRGRHVHPRSGARDVRENYGEVDGPGEPHREG